MENEQTVQGHGDEMETMFVETITPEQESEILVQEFDDFASSLEISIPRIPTEHKSVADKVERICFELRSLSKEDMLILLNAMEEAQPTPTFEEEEE